MTNSIFAIPAAAPAMEVNPKTPAINEMTKNISVQPSIKFLSQLVWLILSARDYLCRISATTKDVGKTSFHGISRATGGG